MKQQYISIRHLSKKFNKDFVLKDINAVLNSNEILGFLGPSGAGKTTTLHAICGLVKAKSGEITFCDHNLRTTDPHKIIRLGLAQVPEGRRIFAKMTVQENLEMGAYIRNDKSGIDADYESVFQRLPRLKERRKQLAGTLSGGEQQMLAIGRALMAKPKMLLLDEPSMGLSPLLVNEIFEIIQDVNRSGVTVLLVEQNAKKALAIANRAYVLETGNISMSGDADTLSRDEKVRKAYLGG